MLAGFAIETRRADIDGLRAVAIVSVLVFHAGFSQLPGGFVGVDVFFVISGYLMTRIILRDLDAGVFTFHRFYLARYKRLMPAVFVTATITLAFGALVLAPYDFEALAQSAIATVLWVSNILFWTEAGYFGASGLLKPLLHTWSLSVEEQFYLAWPAVLVGAAALSRRRRAPLAVVLGATLFAMSAMSLVLAEYSLDYGQDLSFFLTPFRAYEFAIGAGCFLLAGRVSRAPWLNDLLTMAGLAIIGAALILFTEEMRFPGVAALLPCAGTAMVLLSGDRSRLTPYLTPAPVLWIGRISYSLYLVHWPVITLWAYAAASNLTGNDRYVLIAASVALGAFLHYTVENPIHRARVSRQLSFGLIAGCAASIAAAVVVVVSDGFPGRVDLPAEYRGLDGDGFHKASFGGQLCTSQPCFYGATGEKVGFLVAGDSHGHQYAAGVDQLMRTLGVHVAAIHDGACAFFTGDQVKGQRPKDDCPARNAQLRERMAGNGTPLFLAQAWYLYRNYQTPDGVLIDLQGDALELYFKDQMRKFLDAAGKDRLVVLVGSVPGAKGGSPFTCLSRPDPLAMFGIGGGRDRLLECSVTSRSQGRGQLFNTWLADVARSHPNVLFLDPYEALCDATTCRSIIEGKIIYSDNTHLTVDGSRLVVNAFADEIRERMPP